jgi:DNA-binding SARP family transcriptional activator
MNATDMQPASAAAFRIWTCGAFRVERRVGESYQPIGISEWGGSNYPRLLLKVLLCHPRRRVRREAVLELLWGECDGEQALHNLNTGVSKLRNLLRPSKGKASLLLTAEDASWYQLVDQQLLWVDADAALLLLEQAEQAERSGKHPFLLVKQAAQYLTPGAFLEGEEGLWLSGRRATVDVARQRCVLWQASLYEQQDQIDKAQSLVLTLLEEDCTNEDVLCQAMQLLHRRGMTSQAFKLYKRTTEALALDELEPTETTRALAERLRSEVRPIELHTSVLSAHALGMPATQGILLPSSMSMPPSLLEIASIDCATWFSERLAQILAFVTRWQKQIHTTTCQKLLDQELRVFDEVKGTFDADTYFLSRRSALLVIAALPKGLLSLLQYSKTAFIEEDFLPTCAASLTACWYLLNGREFASVERTLSGYMPFLAAWTQVASSYQRTAAYLAAQGCMLLSLVASHQLQKQQRVMYCKEAVRDAKHAGDRVLLVKALTMLGNALYDEGYYHEMLLAYQEASYLVNEDSNKIPAVLQSKVLMGLAHAHAQHGQVQDTLNTISEARAKFPEESGDIPVFLSTDDGLFSLILFEGWVRLDLGNHYPEKNYYEHAAQSLDQIERMPRTLAVPERIRIEILNRQAQAAVAQGNLDAFQTYTLQGIEGLKTVKSEKRRQELVTNYRAARQKWPHESQVLELAEALF